MAKAKSLKSRLKSITSDFFLLLGFSSITTGLYILHPAAALLGGGAMLIFAGVPKTKKPPVLPIAPTKFQGRTH